MQNTNLSYGYSLDLRERVVNHLSQGHTIEKTSQLFNIDRKTIYNWISLKKKTGSLEMCRTGKRSATKFEAHRLKEYVITHSEAYLEEIGAVFKGTASGACRALKRLGVTRKKSPFSTKSVMREKDKSF